MRRAVRVWGGYGPTPTFRLTLDGGGRAFCKGASPASNSHIRRALTKEERAYRDLSHLLAPWAPAFLGSVREEDWHMLLLEDVGPASVPPWTRGRTRSIARAYADFHRSTVGRVFPPWLPYQDGRSWSPGWGNLAETDVLPAVARLAHQECDAAQRWLDAAIPTFSAVEKQAVRHDGRVSLLHMDTRSDNLRWEHGRLRLFDWPYVALGPAELDVAAFAQTVTVEGGALPEEIVA